MCCKGLRGHFNFLGEVYGRINDGRSLSNFPVKFVTVKRHKKQQLELDMEQQTCSKLGKENIKDVYCVKLYK